MTWKRLSFARFTYKEDISFIYNKQS